MDGTAGVVAAPRGRLLLVLVFTVAGDRIAGYDVIADAARLGRLDLAVLPGPAAVTRPSRTSKV